MKYFKILTIFFLGLISGLLIPFVALSGERSLTTSTVHAGTLVTVVPVGENDFKTILIIGDGAFSLESDVEIVYASAEAAFAVKSDKSIEKITFKDNRITREQIDILPESCVMLMNRS